MAYPHPCLVPPFPLCIVLWVVSGRWCGWTDGGAAELRNPKFESTTCTCTFSHVHVHVELPSSKFSFCSPKSIPYNNNNDHHNNNNNDHHNNNNTSSQQRQQQHQQQQPPQHHLTIQWWRTQWTRQPLSWVSKMVCSFFATNIILYICN